MKPERQRACGRLRDLVGIGDLSDVAQAVVQSIARVLGFGSVEFAL